MSFLYQLWSLTSFNILLIIGCKERVSINPIISQSDGGLEESITLRMIGVSKNQSISELIGFLYQEAYSEVQSLKLYTKMITFLTENVVLSTFFY